MGSELGPEFLRKRPAAWLPARAYPLEKGVTSAGNDPDGGDPAISTSMRLEVTWEVEVGDGRPRYQFEETRRAPVWVAGSGFSAGNRWYKVRLKPSAGLLRAVGVPCAVHPDEPTTLWIDWDAAYEEHVTVWERDAAVTREVERRRGGIDGVLARIASPFSRRIDPSEEHLVEAVLAQEEAEREAAWAAASDANRRALAAQAITDEQQRAWVETQRLHEVGRRVDAKVISDADTGTMLGDFPAHEAGFEFELDGQTLSAAYRYAYNAVTAKRLQVGETCSLRVDPDDVTNVAPEL
jgi:hypothetical protein